MRRVVTLLSIVLLTLTACGPVATPAPTAEPKPASTADLSALKTYVVEKSAVLHATITGLKEASDQYYTLAKAANFDYAALWDRRQDEVRRTIAKARESFVTANPQYERMEGIVAGVPGLSQYDVILDAGAAGAAGGEGVVPFDLTLPDGRVLPRPGNLFEVTEAALWGTDPAYTVRDLRADFDGDGQRDLGDSLPDANVLKAAAEAFEKYTAELNATANSWQPTEAEAFGALLTNLPTFSNFMDGWKNSRFVIGEASTERGFVATSRLSDLSDNILSWQTIYAGLRPRVQTVSTDEDAQITQGLSDLQQYVADLYAQEKGGKRFTPEEADTLSAEGQNRATALAGQIAQVAARLGVQLDS